MAESTFKLTYATMFDPPEELHTLFEQVLADVKANFGQEYSMIINNQDHFSEEKFEDRSPVDTNIVLGVFQKGTAEDAHKALAAARAAAPIWGGMKWQERVALIRKAAALIEEKRASEQ